MRFPLPSYVIFFVGLLEVPAAIALPPTIGTYDTKGGWGYLEISMNEDEKRLFKIFTLGANAHMCSLAGEVKGSTGFVIEGADDPTQENIVYPENQVPTEQQCLVHFKQVNNEIAVSSNGKCYGYCGARAGFEAHYYQLPMGCGKSERDKTKSLFLAAYRSKAYSRAYETLNTMYQQCHEFLHWIEIDSVRNDLAISQYHLGNKESCIAILKDTIGFSNNDEEQLSLPPSDFESYLPVAKATWYNLKLCGKTTNKGSVK